MPLAGDGPLAQRTNDSDGEPAPPNWRRIVGLASLGGIVLGILLSVVLIGFVWDDDDEPADGIAGDPSTTVAEFDVATLITTPPTLDPLVLTPPTETGPPPRGPLNLPTTTPIENFGTLPSYPAYTGVPEGGLDSFDLPAAVASLGEDLARRSLTHVEVGSSYAVDVTVVRDPINNRYSAEVSRVFGSQRAIVDVDAGLTYFSSSSDPELWVVTPNSEADTGVYDAELPAYFDRLLLGPIRPDTLDIATVEPGLLVFFEGSDMIAREFAVELPGDAAPEWQLYGLSGFDSLSGVRRPEQLNYTVQVDDTGEVTRVFGSADLGGGEQLVIHQIERLYEPQIVLLPDQSLVRTPDEISG